jgi:hypothetical protein
MRIERGLILELGFCKDYVENCLFIPLPSMLDGDNSDNKFAVIDLIDDSIVADADAPVLGRRQDENGVLRPFAFCVFGR